jgi:hypothetical protein
MNDLHSNYILPQKFARTLSMYFRPRAKINNVDEWLPIRFGKLVVHHSLELLMVATFLLNDRAND